MAISLLPPSKLLPIAGVKVSTISAGIKYQDREDLVLLALSDASSTAVMLTKNQFCAAPVVVTRSHLKVSKPKYLLINSGNANAGQGKQGLADAKSTCASLAEYAVCKVSEVLPFSTGVIGEQLPVEKIEIVLPALLSNLKEDAWLNAAHAIMTTDTIAKGYSEQLKLDGNIISITGIAKGSGMIRPDMATMLAYVATDLSIDDQVLNQMIHHAVEQSFHRITVDGDTSTNDSCVLIATGESKLKFNNLTEQAKDSFITALNSIFIKLAQAIVRDGEGVTKYITVVVDGAKSFTVARDIAFAIAHSPLVKTATFASDPNWGRVLAAAGRATEEQINIENISLFINDLKVIDCGEKSEDYNEESGQVEMQKEEIEYRLHLGAGSSKITIWTTDLSHEYIKINAEYRT